jgi:hypothetical protein
MIELNESQLTLLAERRIASVATVDADGFPHLTATRFLYENKCVSLAIPSWSVKARNLRNNPRLAIMIDARVDYGERGLTAIGNANLLTGDAAASIVERLHQKHLTADALADR